MRQSSSNIDCTGTTALAANTWYHVAGVRDGNTLRLYINGVQENTTSISGSPDTSSAPFAFTALRTNGDSGLTGYMDEIRVSNSCRYTSGTSFTPSTTAFTPDANTLVLIHSDHGVESPEGLGARALFQGGANPGLSPGRRDTVDYVTISTLGNAIDFGNLVAGRSWSTSGFSSRTRAVCAGGYTHPDITDQIDYVTISSTGNYADFGNLFDSRSAAAGASSETRGLFCGGNPANNSTKTDGAEYVTIASTGNGIDFGDIATATASLGGNIQSSTRAFFFGGYTPTNVNTIEYFVTATTGDATDFGDLTTLAGDVPVGFSNSTRGVRSGGTGPSATNTIDYITMTTAGNATDFGDLINATSSTVGGASSPTRGIIAGTDKSPSTYGNVIEYVEIMTTGNAKDFGDLSENRSHANGVSNAHGGL
tara:strand:- start:952 stop:2220 length:1269 start_codon:yes stop_codon:yes gene_type:complete